MSKAKIKVVDGDTLFPPYSALQVSLALKSDGVDFQRATRGDDTEDGAVYISDKVHVQVGDTYVIAHYETGSGDDTTFHPQPARQPARPGQWSALLNDIANCKEKSK